MKKLLCGVDLGGTKLAVGLVNHEGHLLDKIVTYDHTKKKEEGVLKIVADQIKTLLKNNHLNESVLEGIGVGVAGHINYHKGMVITTSNFEGFKNYPFRDRLQACFSVPVVMDNDANAQTYGTFMFGAAKGYDNMIFMTLSTGIGIGIIIDKKLHRGHTGTAGELGHTIVNADSPMQCTCGNYGCLMALASGMALPAVYEKTVKNGIRSMYEDEEGFDYGMVDGKFLNEGVENGDPASVAVVREIARYTGIGLYNVFQIFNPPLILLGGGLLELGESYFNEIKRIFYSLVREMLYDPIDIKISHLGPDSGLLGAAALTLERP